MSRRFKWLIAFMIGVAASWAVFAQAPSIFTYQGYLEREGAPVTDVCDFEVELHAQLVGGVQLASTELSNVPVTDGLFTLRLDFGVPVFNGDARFLEINVTCPGYPFTTLSPRQFVASNPYSIRAYNASSADTAPWSGLTGVPAGFADGIDNGITYARTIIVSPVGTPTENGTALRTALNNITDNSQSNPYLLHIEPGIYDMGSSPLLMKSYVHLQGSGIDLTTISASNSFSGVISSNVITQIRFLTITSGMASENLEGVRVFGGTLSLLHVEIEVDSTFDAIGLDVDAPSAVIAEHVEIRSRGSGNATGIDAASGTQVTLRDTQVNAFGGGVVNSIRNNATLNVFYSTFIGRVLNGGTLRFAGSQLSNGITNTGSVVCVMSYNQNFVALSSTCTT